MVSMPAVVNAKYINIGKRRQQSHLRRLVVDEKAQQHRPYYYYILQVRQRANADKHRKRNRDGTATDENERPLTEH